MDHTATVKQRILERVDPREYFQEQHPEWDGEDNSLVSCPLAAARHEKGTDDRASLSLNGTTGEFNCFSCGFHGTSVVGHYTDVHTGGNIKKALAILYRKYVGEVVSKSEIKELHEALLSRRKVLRRLQLLRGWNKDTVVKFRLGFDEKTKRISIPVYTPAGFAIDIRYHDALNTAARGSEGKRIPIKARNKSTNGTLFPQLPKLNPFIRQDAIWIFEGEPDTILAQQEGLNALTLTGGVGALANLDDWTLARFRDRDVIICLDNDAAGEKAARALAEKIIGIGASSLKRLVCPEGKDFTEFCQRYAGSAELLKQYARTVPYLLNPRRSTNKVVPLEDTSKPEFVEQEVFADVLVQGKHYTPFQVPARADFTCMTDEPCAMCPNQRGGVGEHRIAPDDPDILRWMTMEPEGALKKSLRLGRRCPVDVEIKSWHAIERVQCIPALSNKTSQNRGRYCQRLGYYVGHGIEANASYRITAVPVPDPKTKESILLIRKATGTYDSLKTFALSEERVQQLKELMSDSPTKIMRGVARMMSRNHTRIYGRDRMHIAVDLAYHSPRSFVFAGTPVPKGSLELMLLGDTRCGKGQTVEGMLNAYDLGEVVSGENVSFMGLVGGLLQVKGSFQLTWGAIPLNNHRLVVVDECSGQVNNILGSLSRIRSEGIAEINKGGIASKTEANTRIIWIANPKNGRELASFAHGIQALSDLIKGAEDIARFDLVMVVQKGEVDIDVINSALPTIESKYDVRDLRDIILWVWSRESDHVFFTKEATDYILDAAKKLSQRYSSSIPLVQGENIRFKLAKLSAAVAGRCFSTPDGTLLKVEEQHARTATAFLVACYDCPTTGYRSFSKGERGTLELLNKQELDQLFKQFDPVTQQAFVNGLMEAQYFNVSDMEDWTSQDNAVAKRQVGVLTRCNAVRRMSRLGYEKRPAFIKWLRARKKIVDKQVAEMGSNNGVDMRKFYLDSDIPF